MLEVTDPELLESTGGIVQGMSGSPILQNGKLVGAVTHVLVNDPTRGYGILAQDMLDRRAWRRTPRRPKGCAPGLCLPEEGGDPGTFSSRFTPGRSWDKKQEKRNIRKKKQKNW